MKLLHFLLCAMVVFVSCKRSQREEAHEVDSTNDQAANQLTADEQIAWRSRVPVVLHRLAGIRDTGLAAIRKSTDAHGADSIVATFRSSYARAISMVSDSLYVIDPFQSWILTTPNAADSLAPLLNQFGCSLLLSEGIPSLDLNSGFLLAQFGERLSPAMQKFLSIREREERQGFSDDAALVISWNVLSDRIAEWESFLSQGRAFVLLPEARGWYDLYLGVYLTGLDNTRVFNPQNDSLDADVRASYQRYLSLYPDTKSGRTIAGYLNVLERHGWKNSKEAEAYLARTGIHSTLAVQPPLR